MSHPAYRVPGNRLNNLYHQSSAANYLPQVTRTTVYYTHNTYHRRWPAINSSLYLSVHSPSIVLHPQEETAIIGETCDYRSNRSNSYNQPTYQGNLELEEQMGRVDSRLSEETVIIEQTYDYLPIRAHSNRSHLYNQPTYEENLELEERMGRVNSRLSEVTIMGHLKIRSYDATSKRMNEEPEICVICQGEYEKDELIGGLQCRHEYHVECVKKWLKQHNSCPICKADAVTLST